MPLARSTPARIAAIVAAAIVLLLVVTQLVLPGLGEGAIEDRLTENGGVADVSLSALPAARLLWGDGDEIGIQASGLDLDLDTQPEVFDDLDRFDDVKIAMAGSQAGPIELDSFALTREGDEPYALAIRGSTSPTELAEFVAADSDLPGAGVIAGVIDAAGVGTLDLPLEIDMRLESDSGRVHVIEGDGEIAGIPTGPLATWITNAIVVRL